MATDMKIVTFNLGKEKFGLDIMKIDAVTEYEEVTVIPHVADYLEGVINFRKEEVLPLVNMRRKFKFPDFQEKSKCKVIVIKVGQRKIGIMVDDVKEVKTISTDLIEEKPDVGGMNNVNFISGIARLEDEMLIILDVDKLLNSEEKMSLDQVMEEA
ncbi:chemotaxis protein CheW [Geotoga petraea]|jgi:purine-binding chemotaxis protein CheW|uniref:Purine-binding chemotaxis protein CheW n=1 Tax=Geotoga petraea TaxID=28234 RepID=A0A1G6N459_9BACT|nr:chemotaxis protein CheW [Geotoga petraea]MDK2945536.1 purine-binding chemotaxis protein CheW [Geotoga sp.]TGG87241.1 purine-binding chemotaxis protein CheW [Geotoga petraea]SDC62620.1 purine-binding chemotaxis protein CheW [Geotoga petraea]